jgi:mannosyl-3-phosphoglycerate phosphatase
MDLLFTDLDGTLLDHQTYRWEAASPAIDRLQQLGIPWIFVTSKTRAEVEFWRRRMGNDHAFIVENGGAAYLPRLSGYEVLRWGTPYLELVSGLHRAARLSRCRVRDFHSMTGREIAELCGLPLAQAQLARQREFDEPFLVLNPERAGELAEAIEGQGFHCTCGGRFWHILGANDKALAVRVLIERFGAARTMGLGDGLNDATFLNVVETPVLIRSPQLEQLQALVPNATVTERAGPEGWNEAVLAWLDHLQMAPE